MADIVLSPNAVTAGLQSREQTALELGRSIRTIARWERRGLPVIQIGTLRLHDPASVREWLKSLERRQNRNQAEMTVMSQNCSR